MDYAELAKHELGKYQDYVGENPREPALLRLRDLVSAIDVQTRKVCDELRSHADSMRGAGPQQADRPVCPPERPGALGMLEDSIDRLNETIKELSAQAERNCGLA